MHKSSMQAMKGFFDRLDKDRPLKILDVGSKIAVGQKHCYKDLITSDKWDYKGLDIADGGNVDIVTKHPFHWPVDENEFDIVISGQCLEHIHLLNVRDWIIEINRILKARGKICIIAPSAGPVHHAPPTTYDYWRILPDGMRALLKYANFINIEVFQQDIEPWKDCIGIAEKP